MHHAMPHIYHWHAYALKRIILLGRDILKVIQAELLGRGLDVLAGWCLTRRRSCRSGRPPLVCRLGASRFVASLSSGFASRRGYRSGRARIGGSVSDRPTTNGRNRDPGGRTAHDVQDSWRRRSVLGVDEVRRCSVKTAMGEPEH